MMRKIKKRSIITSLGAAAMLASLSVGGTAFAASTTNTDSSTATTDQAKTYQTQLEEHKNLQAYTNPLTVQALTTTKGVLPDATSGISNWSQVPAGTVAAWDNKPEVNKAGTSYGTVYVTFPDGSRSRLAVYVTVKDSAASQSSKNTNTTSSNKNSSAAVASKSIAKSSQVESEAKTSAKDTDTEKSTTVDNKADKDQASQSSSKSNQDVVVKDLGSTTVTEKNVSVVSNSKDKDKSSNPISVATRLPETVAKATNPFVIICGALITAVSGAVIWSKKLKKRN
ncbi:Rib/alpha-like domain-containing protein [Lactobacillus taiwanensis]|uniref:Rib/alpha-like domain-containing protein n=1 Tax=Lactobacillus taiwanensis TaxID=508451 RepID=UPI000B9984FA|nr:Rib/alpha-like domain-containing protein [Lactobacillus taiwanensis]OYR95378.1 cell wall protein [Lactobacillus taiwanensis]OYS00725.1 cell wall protein [Lactobacillus taiwanensis]OYS11948.1 cell wall protein [Lactobacillus taiwanensis]OYS31912.1 cell wall protein [Lactobacillus taiwanensis]OYS34891.1 cell wall protein [Lactobacillus taiwanensis]